MLLQFMCWFVSWDVTSGSCRTAGIVTRADEQLDFCLCKWDLISEVVKSDGQVDVVYVLAADGVATSLMSRVVLWYRLTTVNGSCVAFLLQPAEDMLNSSKVM
jgi:hypothetical protein